MQYQSDYVLRLIEQMGALIRRALERVGGAETGEPYEDLQAAIGLALDMEPHLASRLSPQSLVALLEIETPDDRVVGLVADAFDASADLLESRGELVEGMLKREQAAAVRSLLDPSRAN